MKLTQKMYLSMSDCSLKTDQEARKLGLLPPGKSFEAVCERLEPQERKERVFKGQPDIDDFNCIIWANCASRAQST